MLKIAFLLASAALFYGCSNECDHDYTVMNTHYDLVRPSDWRLVHSADETYYFATRSFPEVNNNVIQRGAVLCYLIENGRDNILPYLRPWGFNSFNEPYFQNVRFDVERGRITFIVEASDFELPEEITWSMEFKVVIMQNVRH